MNTALLFPGQGSQKIGMCQSLYYNFPIARECFELTDNILNCNLSKLIFHGTQEELNLTSNTQPALATASIACLNVLLTALNKKINDIAVVTAGHSLGEYSALCATHVINYHDTINIVRKRGYAMQNAINGSMIAVLGIDIKEAEKIARETECYIANDNGAGQVVLSGESMEKVVYVLKTKGYKAISLSVSGAFHSPLMANAAKIIQQELHNIKINQNVIPVIFNVDAQTHKSEDIPNLLVQQMTERVRWRETIELMINQYSIQRFIEIGPGKVLQNLVKRIDGDKEVYGIESIDDLEKILKIF